MAEPHVLLFLWGLSVKFSIGLKKRKKKKSISYREFISSQGTMVED